MDNSDSDLDLSLSNEPFQSNLTDPNLLDWQFRDLLRDELQSIFPVPLWTLAYFPGEEQGPVEWNIVYERGIIGPLSRFQRAARNQGFELTYVQIFVILQNLVLLHLVCIQFLSSRRRLPNPN